MHGFRVPICHRDGYDCTNRIAADVLKYIEILEDYNREIFEKMPKWVSVKERLPQSGLYLCCLNGGFRTIRHFDGEQWEDAEGGAYATWVVTHWMPLPQPPEED